MTAEELYDRGIWFVSLFLITREEFKLSHQTLSSSTCSPFAGPFSCNLLKGAGRKCSLAHVGTWRLHERRPVFSFSFGSITISRNRRSTSMDRCNSILEGPLVMQKEPRKETVMLLLETVQKQNQKLLIVRDACGGLGENPAEMRLRSKRKLLEWRKCWIAPTDCHMWRMSAK